MLKTTKFALAAVMGLTLLTTAAFADIGVVDTDAILQKYSKGQELTAQSKEKEAALQKVREDLLTQLKAGEKLSPVEKKNLEDKLNQQFAEKVKEYRDWSAVQQQAVREAFDKAVKEVSESEKLDMVLNKSGVVLQGGKDITEDVLNVMNK